MDNMESEFRELVQICRERGVTPEQLLEEKVAPWQERISRSPGELIAALTRDFKQCSYGGTPVHYTLSETLHTGLITPETRFLITEMSPFDFLLGVNKPYSIEMDSVWEIDFRERNDGSFGPTTIMLSSELLYFMDKPPEVPADSMECGCFGSHSTTFPTEKPRLELYVGNQQAVPFLQQNLEGWRYLQLAKLLGYDLPVTDDVRKKIEKEQLSLFDNMRPIEARSLQFEEDKKRFLGLLKTAVKRGYHESGVQVERKLDAGVVVHINLQEYFAQKRALFGL